MYTTRTRIITISFGLIFLLSFLLGPQIQAQQLNFQSDTDNANVDGQIEIFQQNPKIQQMLQTLLVRPQMMSAFKAGQFKLEDASLIAPSNEPTQIVIEVSNQASVSQVIEAINTLGGRFESAYKTSVQARLTPEQMNTLSDLEAVEFIRLPLSSGLRQVASGGPSQGDVVSEGLEDLGVASWHEAGFSGKGVHVGVLDTFLGVEDQFGIELPPADRVTTESFSQSGLLFDPDGNPGIGAHGVGVSEIIHDIVPDADLSLAFFETDVELRQAVDFMIDQEVDVLNTSLGLYSGCLSDVNGSILEPQIEEARQKGINWITASSNEGDRQHYSATFTDNDNNRRHEFSDGDEDLTLDMFIFEDDFFGDPVAVGFVFMNFGWDGPCSRAQNLYNIEVSAPENASETFKGGLDSFSDWLWFPGFPVRIAIASYFSEDLSLVGTRQKVNFAVTKRDEDTPNMAFEILIESCSCDFDTAEHLTTEGTISLTEPSQSPNAVSIGAVHHTPSSCPRGLCPDGQLLVYSSKGPTPHGELKPDLVAPTHVSTVAFGDYTGDGRNGNRGFTGTSAATPHAVGAFALVLDAFPEFSPAQALQFLETRSEDAGAPGKDTEYGSGILLMGQPPASEEDRTPPFTPVALNVAPQSWTNNATFNVLWTSASDDVGDVAAAWYKLGSAPTSFNDGTRTVDNPFSITANTEGETDIFVWLEDSAGNVTQANRISGTLRYDATAPTGKLLLNGGDAFTVERSVTIDLTAQDNASGVVEMRFSEDAENWSGFQSFRETASLTLSEGFGEKSVFVQYRDRAGNLSEPIGSDISVGFSETVSYEVNVAELVMLTIPTDLIELLPENARFVDSKDALFDLGLSLNEDNGNIVGTPNQPGVFELLIDVVLGESPVGNINLQLQVNVTQIDLASNEVVGGIATGNGLSVVYRIDVPEGTENLIIKARGQGGGNIDLYVSKTMPIATVTSLGNSDFASRSFESSETLDLHHPDPGTYFISVHNPETLDQKFSLVATVVTGYAVQIEPIDIGFEFADRVAGAPQDNSSLGLIQYEIEVDDAESLTVMLTNLGPGNLKLHVRFGQPVAWVNGQAVSDWTSASRTAVESITLLGESLKAGVYYIAIETQEPFEQSFLLNTLLDDI